MIVYKFGGASVKDAEGIRYHISMVSTRKQMQNTNNPEKIGGNHVDRDEPPILQIPV
jgi:ribosomal protein S12